MASKTPLPPGVVWEDSPPPLPKGIVWEDGGQEESFLDKARIGVKALGMMGKDMLVSGLAGIPQMLGAGPRASEGVPLPYNPFAGLKAVADRFEKKNSDLKEISPYLHAMVQGAVTGGLTSPNNAVRAASAVSGALGGTGAEFGAQATKGTGFEPLGAVAGGLLGGMAGFGLGPRQSLAQQNIRDEIRHYTPAQWAEIRNNAQVLLRSKADTATAAEAFPGRAGVKGLAVKAATSDGGELLRDRLALREDDLIQMGNVIPGLVDTNPGGIAYATRSAAEAANNRMATIKSATQRPLAEVRRMEQSGQLPPIPRSMARGLVRDFESLAAKEGLPRADVLARQDLISAFLDPNAPPWTRNLLNLKTGQLEPVLSEGPQRKLSALMLNIAENTPSSNSASARAGLTIPRQGQDRARQTAFDVIYLMPDPYASVAAKASDAYLKRKEAWLSPAKEDTLQKIAGTKSPEGVVLSEAQLSAIMRDAPKAGATEKLMQELGKGGADKAAIARALVEQELITEPQNFAKKLADVPGSIKERQFYELLKGADVNADPIRTRIEASRLMDLKPGMAIKEVADMRPWQYLIRPFRTLDMAITKNTFADVQREVTELLKDPRNIDRLEEIAKFEPNVRKAMALRSTLLPGLQQGLARNEE